MNWEKFFKLTVIKIILPIIFMLISFLFLGTTRIDAATLPCPEIGVWLLEPPSNYPFSVSRNTVVDLLNNPVTGISMVVLSGPKSLVDKFHQAGYKVVGVSGGGCNWDTHIIDTNAMKNDMNYLASNDVDIILIDESVIRCGMTGTIFNEAKNVAKGVNPNVMVGLDELYVEDISKLLNEGGKPDFVGQQSYHGDYGTKLTTLTLPVGTKKMMWLYYSTELSYWINKVDFLIFFNANGGWQDPWVPDSNPSLPEKDQLPFIAAFMKNNYPNCQTPIGNPIIAPNSPSENTGFTIYCPIGGEYDCIGANAIEGNSSTNCPWIGWDYSDGYKGIFNCRGMSSGTYTAECYANPNTPAHCKKTQTEITYDVISHCPDINADGKIDILDIAIVAKAFGSKLGEINWNEKADIDKNGVINILDISLVAKQFGVSCSS